MMRFCVGLAVFALVHSQSTSARPISYPGGWTVIEETDRQTTSLWTHYTLTPRWSLGARSEWDRQQDYVFNGVQATYLAKRWFGENYQANVYAIGGAGVATNVGARPTNTNASAFAGVLADWETRRLFASYRIRYLEAGAVGESFVQAVRLGVAPYEGDTGDLHTWLMVEVDHRSNNTSNNISNNTNEVGVTPVVRLFKGAALLELGWSITDDEPLVNFTYRF